MRPKTCRCWYILCRFAPSAKKPPATTIVHPRINTNRILHTTIFKDSAHSESSVLSFTLRRRWRHRTRIEEQPFAMWCANEEQIKFFAGCHNVLCAFYEEDANLFVNKYRAERLCVAMAVLTMMPWWNFPHPRILPTSLFLFSLLPLNSIISFFFSSILCPWLRIPFGETDRAVIWKRQWHWYEWAVVVCRAKFIAFGKLGRKLPNFE